MIGFLLDLEIFDMSQNCFAKIMAELSMVIEREHADAANRQQRVRAVDW